MRRRPRSGTRPDGRWSVVTRRIEYVPLDDVTPDPANPKAHQLDTITDSVGRFGYVEPMVRDDRTGYLVSGHGRLATLRAMQERGEQAPDGVKVGKDGAWQVPMSTGWSSRSDTEARAALIALNRTTELGGWVDESLLAVLEELGESGEPDAFDGIGYGQADLDVLRQMMSGPVEVEPLSDEDFGDLIGEDGLGAGETLKIEGVPNSDISRFRSLDGESDAERLHRLLDLADIEQPAGEAL